MRSEKRKNKRKPMRYAAWVQDGEATPQSCVLADISDTGARLEVADPEAIPDSFTLLLGARESTPQRRCRVKWRSEEEIGVQFEARAAAAR